MKSSLTIYKFNYFSFFATFLVRNELCYLPMLDVILSQIYQVALPLPKP